MSDETESEIKDLRKGAFEVGGIPHRPRAKILWHVILLPALMLPAVFAFYAGRNETDVEINARKNAIFSPDGLQAPSKTFSGFGDGAFGETLETIARYKAVLLTGGAIQKRNERTPRTIRFKGPSLISPAKMTHIPPGTYLSATLISGASNGPVKAKLDEPLKVNGERIYGSDSVLLGVGKSTDERLIIHFNKLVTKDGETHDISAHAMDWDDKIVGLKGSKIGDYSLKLAASLGLNFLSGASDILQDRDVVSGVVMTNPNLKNALLNGVKKTALDESKEVLESAKSEIPIIEVSAGTKLFVLFEGDTR